MITIFIWTILKWGYILGYIKMERFIKQPNLIILYFLTC